MKTTKAQCSRSVIAALGLSLLVGGVWQIVDHSPSSSQAMIPPQGPAASSHQSQPPGPGPRTPAPRASMNQARQPGQRGTSAPVEQRRQGQAQSPAGTRRTGPDRTTTAGVIPTRLTAPSIGIDANVTAEPTRVGYDQWLKRTVTQFGVPNNDTGVAWWSDGPQVGSSTGMAVLLGHTTIGGNGVFNRLSELRTGATMTVTGRSTSRELRVTTVVPNVSKRDPTALQKALGGAPAGSVVALVTCSGDVNPSGTSHADNTVVFLA